MKLHNVILIGVILAIALLVGSVAAEAELQQGNGASVNGNGNSVDLSNTAVTNNEHATYYSKSTSFGGSSSVSNNNYYSIQGSSVQQLAKTDIVMDRVIQANQVLEIPIRTDGNTTFIFKTGIPVAVYTTDALHVFLTQGRDSILTPDLLVYDKMDTGSLVPIDMVPFLSSDYHITPSIRATYLIVDNRYYPTDTEAQIATLNSSTEL